MWTGVDMCGAVSAGFSGPLQAQSTSSQPAPLPSPSPSLPPPLPTRLKLRQRISVESFKRKVGEVRLGVEVQGDGGTQGAA